MHWIGILSTHKSIAFDENGFVVTKVRGISESLDPCKLHSWIVFANNVSFHPKIVHHLFTLSCFRDEFHFRYVQWNLFIARRLWRCRFGRPQSISHPILKTEPYISERTTPSSGREKVSVLPALELGGALLGNVDLHMVLSFEGEFALFEIVKVRFSPKWN